MAYQSGQRVVLVKATDSESGRRRGVRGSVVGNDGGQRAVHVRWDGEATADLVARDQLIPIASESGVQPDAWGQVLAGLVLVGAAEGRKAADPGAQDDARGHATSADEHGAIERGSFQGVDGADAAPTDAVPRPDRRWVDLVVDEAVHITGGVIDTESVRRQVAAGRLTDEQWSEAEALYTDAYVTAAAEAIGRRPRQQPDADRDPDRLTVGHMGVFSGDWNSTSTYTDDGELLYEVGYVGTLVDHWNGWAVFRCSLEVAAAVVADHERDRIDYRTSLVAAGATEEDADRRVDDELVRLYFDGPVLVQDHATLTGDPSDVEHVEPGTDGSYIVMGYSWCWEPVAPANCLRVVGMLPAHR